MHFPNFLVLISFYFIVVGKGHILYDFNFKKFVEALHVSFRNILKVNSFYYIYIFYIKEGTVLYGSELHKKEYSFVHIASLHRGAGSLKYQDSYCPIVLSNEYISSHNVIV